MKRYYLEFETEGVHSSDRTEARAILNRISDALSCAGFEILDGVADWEGYGWSLVFSAGGTPLWCMIQRSDGWLLISWEQTQLLDRLRRSMDRVEAVSARRQIAKVVATMAGRSGLQWLTEDEFRRS